MAPHTHDGIDWVARVSDMRRADELHAATLAGIAERLTRELPENPIVVDVGSGTGGMSAALAAAVAGRGGGTLLLVDAVPELLSVAAETARSQVGARHVTVEVVNADVASENLRELVPPAHLIWASAMVHHLPDQQAAVVGFVGALARGGVLALAEGGLEPQCLPWDLGTGEPGWERRLLNAREACFGELRATIPGVVRMPYGWNVALGRAGLVDIGSFSVVLDHPAPLWEAAQDYVVDRIKWLVEIAGERLTVEDRRAAGRLLDPSGSEYIGRRDDLYLLGARTVHFGRLW